MYHIYWQPNSNSSKDRQTNGESRGPVSSDTSAVWRHVCWWPSVFTEESWTCRQTGRLADLKHAALITVSGAAGWSPPQFPALSWVVGPCVVSSCLVPWLLQPDVAQPLTILRLHLEVGAHTVVLGHGAAEVNDTTLVCALVWWLDTGETELVGDVATSHFDHLMRTYIYVRTYCIRVWFALVDSRNEIQLTLILVASLDVSSRGTTCTGIQTMR